MKKVRCILLAVMGALAVQGFSEPFRVLNPEAKSIKGDVKVELGEGCGETREEALKEALKDVLQKVVGVYVDSDFRMNNDEIIKDQIITHSNGFIEKYTVLDEADEESGRGKVVTIRARVKIREVFNRIKKIVPTQTVAVDGALVSNEVENQLNAEKLLRNLLEDFDIRSIMEIKLADSIRPEILSLKDGVVVMRYAFVVKYSDQKYYKEFLPRLDRVMNQIAKGKPKMKTIDVESRNGKYVPIKFKGVRGKGSYSCSRDDEECVWSGHSVSATYYPNSNREDFMLRNKSASVIWRLDPSGSVRLKEWPLPTHLLNVFLDLRNEIFLMLNPGSLFCKLTIRDQKGEELADSVSSLPFGSWTGSLEEIMFPPFLKTVNLFEDGNFQECYAVQHVGFIAVPINQSDLSKIKSVQIKLTTQNEGEEE